MEIEKLREWNPWWDEKKSILRLRGKSRSTYESLIGSVNVKQITIITGVRRSGKSTLMYEMIAKLLEKNISPEQILFVNLEDKRLSEDSLDDIYDSYRQFLNPGKKAFIFLDEIHKKEDWEHWIRKKYDLKTNDKFVISGSSSYLLKREYSTLLTGRNRTFEVFPLSFEEFLSFRDIKVERNKVEKNIILKKTQNSIIHALGEYLEFGGFPEVTEEQKKEKLNLLKQYFDDILYKDIVDRYELNSQKVEDFVLFLMTNFTGILSLRNMRNSLGLSYDTIKDYLSYTKEAFLIFIADHFSYSFKEQKTLASKIYCIDNGLRNAVSFKFSKDEGKLSENLVFFELNRRDKRAYYWKSQNEREVDFIVKNKDQSLTAINVTYTDEIEDREIVSLLEFKEKFQKTKELIIITRNTEKKEKGIIYIPLWKWLLLD